MTFKPSSSVGASLRQKTKEIDAQIEHHLQAIKRLEADRSEIETTRATLVRLGIIEPIDVTAHVIGTGHFKKTVPDMILDILAHDFRDGSEPHAVLTKIKEKFDPNADPNNVRPTMWRMAKDGRLEKHGDKYRLPQKNEAAGTPNEDAPTASAQEQPTWARSANPA